MNARHEAVVQLRVRGPGGAVLDVDAVIDSGFTASLTLPATTAATARPGSPVGRWRGDG